MEKKCLNCGAEVSGPYCPACGQDASVARLNIRQILSSAASHFFDMDAVVPRTFLALTRNPGKVAREYVDGRRKTYVAPFRYCLTAVGLMMLAFALVGRNAEYFLFEVDRSFSPAMLKFQAETMSFVLRHLNVVTFAALPLQALVLRLLFRRSRYNYAEVMSFTLYVNGHYFLLNAIVNEGFFPVSELQFTVRFLAQTAYLIFAAIGFFGGNRILTIFKSMMASIINTIIVMILVLILITPRFLTLVKELKAEKAAAATAVEAGAKLLSECEDRDWGDRAGYCLDNDGHVLAFAIPID